MQVRIAISIMPRPGGDPAGNGIKNLAANLPATCFLLDGNGSGPTGDKGARGTPHLARIRGADLRTAARRARACGATHLMVLRQVSPDLGNDVDNLAMACQAHPEAVIIGRRQRPGQPFPRFWLKMQTGCQLNDPLSALRIYPLAVIEHLRLYQGGAVLWMEILVKAAWADVPFREAPVTTDFSVRQSEQPFLGEPVWRFLLNIHYTLRSVLPVPHRKLESDTTEAGAKISVWRPMRALRTLLRENTSPTQLALAAAMGVFLGTLPLIACHSLVIMLAANYFRLNKIAALASSQLCMPPVVPALCIETGYLLRHGRFLTEISMETLGYQALERLYEWLLGSLVLAPLLAGLAGLATLLMARIAARSMATVRSLGSGTR